MEITDVRIKLAARAGDRLKAYCTIVLDGEFVVRDVRIVDGTNGLFVAMPSRKLTIPCHKCGFKNALLARFCNECGGKLPRQEPASEADNRLRLHRDIAHPITGACRELLQQRVIEAYEAQRDEVIEEEDYEDSLEGEAEAETETADQMDEPETVEQAVEEEHGEEPVDEEVVDEQVEEPSAYGDLIASLRRRPGESTREPTPAPAVRSGGGSDRPPRKGPSRDRGRSRERTRSTTEDRPRESAPPRSQRNQERDRPAPAAPPKREKMPMKPRKPAPIKTETGVPAFGAMIVDQDEANQAKPVSKMATPDAAPPPAKPADSDRPSPPPEPQQQNDDAGSFGAGLL